jgi:Na+/H+ antiporter NhaA
VVVPLFALANAGVTVNRDALAGAGGALVLLAGGSERRARRP